MFRKSNEDILLGLDDFIEKPSQNCKDEEIKDGVDKVLIVLNKNPTAIMNFIANHPFIAATYLLDDLAEKMRKQNSIEKLDCLFDSCLDELIEACIYNLEDLDRCFKIKPAYFDKIIQNILSDEHRDRGKRILEADKNCEATLKQIEEKYPQYKIQFSEFYTKNFSQHSAFKMK